MTWLRQHWTKEKVWFSVESYCWGCGGRLGMEFYLYRIANGECRPFHFDCRFWPRVSK
jgi:hypothetical protein